MTSPPAYNLNVPVTTFYNVEQCNVFQTQDHVVDITRRGVDVDVKIADKVDDLLQYVYQTGSETA